MDFEFYLSRSGKRIFFILQSLFLLYNPLTFVKTEAFIFYFHH